MNSKKFIRKVFVGDENASVECEVRRRLTWRLILLSLSPLPLVFLLLYFLYCYVNMKYFTVELLQERSYKLERRIQALEQRLNIEANRKTITEQAKQDDFLCLAGCVSPSMNTPSVSMEIVPLSTTALQVYKMPYACEVEEGEDVKSLKMNVDFLVVFRNNSNGTFAFGSEEFSFDYYDLTLEIKNDKGEIVELTKRPGRIWTRNFWFYRYVGPGRSIAYPVTMDPRVWKDIPEWLWNGGLGARYSVRAKFTGGYLLDGDESQCDQKTNVVKLGKDCGELVSDWKSLYFGD